jgi:choline dehydrogenase-like flavoprotein
MGDPNQQHNFDAIVIGSGISGGWAAKELCEKGLKTLVLERGRDVQHIKDYPTAFLNPWDLPNRLEHTEKEKNENPIRTAYGDAASDLFFVKDSEHPYVQEKPFTWVRGYQVGGRSLTWGRQSYRYSDLDFGANEKDGIAVDWPIRYKDLAPWYDYVENYVGISGQKEDYPWLPDGNFLPPMELNCIETHFAQKTKEKYPGRVVTPSAGAGMAVAPVSTAISARGAVPSVAISAVTPRPSRPQPPPATSRFCRIPLSWRSFMIIKIIALQASAS